MTLTQFLKAHLYQVDGHSVPFKLIHELYCAATDDETALNHRVAFSRALKVAGFKTAVTNNNRTRIVNASVNPLAKPTKRLKLRKSKATARKRIAK